MSKLTGKVAIVTGASKGIGAAIAKALAAEGAAVVVNYASSQAGADAKGVIDAAIAAFGRLDILVNNSGVYEFAPLEAITEESFHKMFNLNVLGLILSSQEALKYFGEAGGSIINIGSVASSSNPPTASVYTATKGAVDSVTRTLSKELGPKNIRVNSINPGMVETEGVHTAGFIGSDFQKWAESQTPLGRIGQPKDIAPVAVFLASDDSSWLTGELILAGGGSR